MEPFLFIDSFGEFVVTVKTSGVRQAAAKSVAFCTVLNALILCVRIRKLTGADERTKPVRGPCTRWPARNKRKSKYRDQ